MFSFIALMLHSNLYQKYNNKKKKEEKNEFLEGPWRANTNDKSLFTCFKVIKM